MSLLYSNKLNFHLVGFVDFGYLFYQQKTRSQTDYLFMCGETTIDHDNQ